MKKSKMHIVKSGDNVRLSFAKGKDIQEMPNLIEVQSESYIWFYTKGIAEVLKEISPIEDPSGNLKLEFISCHLDKDHIDHTIEECKERDTTYQAPLYVEARLTKKELNEVIEEKNIFMGDLPLMTENGSFIVNGAERVIVSQMVRSPGIYFDFTRDKFGKQLFTSQIIPNRGAWIEYECDVNDVCWARLDKTRKVPITVLLRSLGLSSDEDLNETFGEEPYIIASINKEDEKDRNHEAAIIELYRKIKPGEPLTPQNAESQLNNTLYDKIRYDLGRAGRYMFNKKLHFKFRLRDQKLADDVVNIDTGEIIATKGTRVDEDLAIVIQNSGVPFVYIDIVDGEGNKIKQKILSNMMVDINQYIKGVKPEEWEQRGITELVFYPLLKEILDDNKKGKKGKESLLDAIEDNSQELVPKHIIKEDIYASVNYICHLQKGVGYTDDIDHLGNRRIRAVGELLQNQYRQGLQKVRRTICDKMSTSDIPSLRPQSLINIRPIQAAVREFFGSSQLSQFMDQNNPLSELTHKRRLSALGPGGISRDRAGLEVRDVHYTHYGRVCPIETPEGPNIGLINSLASYARINKYGFIEAPYRRVDKTDPKNPVVTNEVRYMTADEEDRYKVAQASEPLDEAGHFINNNVSGRFRDDITSFKKHEVDFMDVSPRMVFSVATSMIPFIQNDDANRALMGSNMQRQAVPLMITETSCVGTGIENKVAIDSGVCVVAKADGEVIYVDSKLIKIRDNNGEIDIYNLSKFSRSNQSNSYNQKPIVDKGQKVKKGDIIADGPSISRGELALGKNPLIGFMTWEGYNYEDAVLLSENLVKNDVYTSINIEEYEVEARETKVGPEEITRDVQGSSDKKLADLDQDGIIRLGAKVRTGDILVGKVTPKGDQELTSEEKLLRAIFKEKEKEVKDTSLKLPHGAYGTVIGTKVFSRDNKIDKLELPNGILKKVRVYVAQKRKISVGDKMAGRHGNKGVVSRVLPVEDMPYLPNGRPLDIVLNPLGVPSRMNIGQILETHLSLASKFLGIDISTPTFEGATEEDIQDTLQIANDYVNEEWDVFKDRYKDIIEDDVMTYLGEHLEHREEWKGVHINKDGRVLLRDGRTGEYFDSPTTIGFMNYLKLHHLVDDKIHARSVGPYGLITQQPLGGKAQFGGQRFGEMEVWALEAYGAAYTLQEILTVKSDDIVGRTMIYNDITMGKNLHKPIIPESFKVLLKELQALCLDVTLLDENNNEVPMVETNYDPREENKAYQNEKMYIQEKDLLKNGYTQQAFYEGQLEDVKEEDDEFGSEDDFDDIKVLDNEDGYDIIKDNNDEEDY